MSQNIGTRPPIQNKPRNREKIALSNRVRSRRIRFSLVYGPHAGTVPIRRGGWIIFRPLKNCSKISTFGSLWGPFLELEWPRDTGCGYMGGNQPHGALYYIIWYGP